MSALWYQVAVLFRKEVRIILKDPRSRFILIVPILLQSVLFGYAASYDLNTVPYALLDEDHSTASRDLTALLEGSGIFVRVATLQNVSQTADMLDHKRALLVVHIGRHFERGLQAGEATSVQLAVDGRNANIGGVAAGYASAVFDTFSRKWQAEHDLPYPSLRVETRAWFNPNLKTRWNMIPGLAAALAMIQTILLTALSVAREKEQGTFDQLMVTPLGPSAIMLGKSLPSVVIGLVQSTLILLVAFFWFRIPFSGSLPLLYAGLLLFNFAVVGIGLCISALTSTMQQAMLYSFSFIMPMMLLSGFTTPISSMPDSVQIATYANPLRYGVDFAQRIYLEGAGFTQVAGDFWPLLLISFVTLGLATLLFRKRLG